MKFVSAIILAAALNDAYAFAPNSMGSGSSRASTAVKQQVGNGMDLSGNSWKPDSEKMGSTDTGDYFPEGYDPSSNPDFSEGMMGSQQMLGGGEKGTPTPRNGKLGRRCRHDGRH
eukprot:765614_1